MPELCGHSEDYTDFIKTLLVVGSALDVHAQRVTGARVTFRVNQRGIVTRRSCR